MKPEFVEQLLRICKLIDAGVLPKGAAPRLMAHSYGGHLSLHSVASIPEYKCVTCGWVGKEEHHQCEGAEVYQINHDHNVRWQCVSCSHQWTSPDGDLCPECLAGPLTGMLELVRTTHGLPQSVRDKWPVLRDLDDIRCSGVPQAMVIEAYADKKGISYDDALLAVAMEWWLRLVPVE